MVCIETEMRAEAFVEEGLKRCGIPDRFLRFESWDELKGSPAYSLAVSAVRAFTAKHDSVMAVVGPRGTGKTQAACMALMATIRSGRTARYTTAFKLFADLKGRYGQEGNAENEWLREWSGPYLLVVDEIAERHGTDHELTALTSLVDERYGNEKPTILVGNISIDGVCDALGSSIADRINDGGGIVEFNGWQSFRGSQA